MQGSIVAATSGYDAGALVGGQLSESSVASSAAKTALPLKPVEKLRQCIALPSFLSNSE